MHLINPVFLAPVELAHWNKYFKVKSMGTVGLHATNKVECSSLCLPFLAWAQKGDN